MKSKAERFQKQVMNIIDDFDNGKLYSGETITSIKKLIAGGIE